jgi:hypothetical protein
MKASTAKKFRKKLACPSSTLLVAFNLQELTTDLRSAVTRHLDNCDFCYCELPLLAFYTQPRKGECRTPDLPMNLRMLAESILGRCRSVTVGG